MIPIFPIRTDDNQLVNLSGGGSFQALYFEVAPGERAYTVGPTNRARIPTGRMKKCLLPFA